MGLQSFLYPLVFYIGKSNATVWRKLVEWGVELRKIYEKYLKDDLITDFNYFNYTSEKQIIKHKENLERWVLKCYMMYYLRPRKEYLDLGMWKMLFQIYR